MMGDGACPETFLSSKVPVRYLPASALSSVYDINSVGVIGKEKGGLSRPFFWVTFLHILKSCIAALLLQYVV